jgi:DNA-binding GntR family transcriptional regulator
LADNKSFMKSLQAYEKIRDMILTGYKLPGTRLVLSELESELGIGRGPIREALMRLDRSGLVKNIPYKGAIVATPPTQKEILHIYDLRADLEATLAVEAIDNLTDADFLKLEELIAIMEELPQNHYQLDRQFHRVICDASRLPHMKMTTEEAFVKVLQMHGIEHAFGIIGSAMMPISDLFPKAGITFWDCGHEGNAGMMADGFTRASGKMSMMVAQNGPGITNFVTPVKTAYWNHTPLLLVTAQAANMTMGQGGFQEVPQMAVFEDMVAYQEEVLHPSRMAEVLNRVIMQAKRASAPAQINVPRDFWTQVIDIELPAIVEFERPAGGEEAIARAAELLSNAKFPVILNGGGVVIGGAIKDSMALAERLDAPVCCGYQHNDAFPGSHPLFAGPWATTAPKPAWS